jgi:hypothetical protein
MNNEDLFSAESLRLSPELLTKIKNRQTQKSPTPPKQKDGFRFYKFPPAVLLAIYQTKYLPALAVAMAVFEGRFRTHKNPVKLTSALLAKFGVSKNQKLKAVRLLEQTGHFLVERSSRRNPLVMVKWELPER